MNFASMYLLGFCVCLVLGLTALAVWKKVGDSDRLKSSFGFLYCFFVFGLTFAGCASLQGALMNPLSKIDANGVFYLFGIFAYLGVFLECWFSFRRYRDLWKVRVFIKATVLSLAHFNPVFLVTMLVFVEVALAIVDYKYYKSTPRFNKIVLRPKIWLANQILA